MDYRDNRQRWAESHQVVHFYAGQWCTFTPALTLLSVEGKDAVFWDHDLAGFGVRVYPSGCSAPGSLDTSLSHAAGLIEIAACHA